MLDTIPAKLFGAILDYLPEPSVSDFAGYCLVLRALLPPARRRLYRQLKVILVAQSHGIVRQHPRGRRGVWQPDASTLNLLATLEAHPHLRGLPRSVAVEAQRPFTTVSSQCPAAVNAFRCVLRLCPEADSVEMLSPGPPAPLRSLLDDATPRKLRHLGLARLGDEEWELLRQQDSLSRLDLDLASRFRTTLLDPPASPSFHLTHLTIDFSSLVGPEARAAPEQQHQAPLLFFGALLRSSFATLRTLHLTIDSQDFSPLPSLPPVSNAPLASSALCRCRRALPLPHLILHRSPQSLGAVFPFNAWRALRRRSARCVRHGQASVGAAWLSARAFDPFPPPPSPLSSLPPITLRAMLSCRRSGLARGTLRQLYRGSGWASARTCLPARARCRR